MITVFCAEMGGYFRLDHSKQLTAFIIIATCRPRCGVELLLSWPSHTPIHQQQKSRIQSRAVINSVRRYEITTHAAIETVCPRPWIVIRASKCAMTSCSAVILKQWPADQPGPQILVNIKCLHVKTVILNCSVL
jgi:hypothetical protein